MSAKNELDQYYTNPAYAAECYVEAEKYCDESALFMEACVGAGAFYFPMPETNRIGFDLEPQFKDKDVYTGNFFDVKPRPAYVGMNVISNPPFGRNASLAVDFFNHCAFLGANVIAFVIPKSFRKASVQNKLNKEFHLVYDKESPKNAFILHGKEYHVPCCFQVWIRKDKERELINTSHDNPWFNFCSKTEADVAVRRVGGRAGQLLEGVDHSVESTYFLKSKIDIEELKHMLSSIDLSYERDNTAGVRSVAKFEIVNKLSSL